MTGAAPAFACASEAPGFDLGAAVCSRICHDLISPVGAVGNGLELLRLSGDDSSGGGGGGEAELDLIGRSAETAAATLALLRLAFGAAEPDDRMSWEAARRVTRRWSEGRRARLDWPIAEGEAPRAHARLSLNLIQAADSALPRGGTVSVVCGAALTVTAEGTGAAVPPDAALWLTGDPGPAPPSPRDIHWLVAGRHAALMGLSLTLEASENALRLSAA